MPDDKWPLIPDVVKLTQFVTDDLKSKTEEKNDFDKLIDEVILSEKDEKNIEDILSFLRGLKDVSVGNSVRSFTKENLVELKKNICNKIVEKLEVNLPDKDTPYHLLENGVDL